MSAFSYRKNHSTFNSLGIFKEYNNLYVPASTPIKAIGAAIMVGVSYMGCPTDPYALMSQGIKFGLNEATLNTVLLGAATVAGCLRVADVMLDKRNKSEKSIHANPANLTSQMQWEDSKDLTRNQKNNMVVIGRIDPAAIYKLQYDSVLGNIFKSWQNELDTYDNGKVRESVDTLEDRERKNEIAIRLMREIAEIQDSPYKAFFDELMNDNKLYLETSECSDAIISLFNDIAPDIDSFSKLMLNQLSKDSHLTRSISEELSNGSNLAKKVENDFFDRIPKSMSEYSEQLMRMHLGQLTTKLAKIGEKGKINSDELVALRNSIPDNDILYEYSKKSKSIASTVEHFRNISSYLKTLEPNDQVSIRDIGSVLNQESTYFDHKILSDMASCKPKTAGGTNFLENNRSEEIINNFLEQLYTNTSEYDFNGKMNSLNYIVNSGLLNSLVENTKTELKKGMFRNDSGSYYNVYCPENISRTSNEISESNISRRVINQKALDAFVQSVSNSKDEKVKDALRKVNQEMGL